VQSSQSTECGTEWGEQHHKTEDAIEFWLTLEKRHIARKLRLHMKHKTPMVDQFDAMPVAIEEGDGAEKNKESDNWN
jgi:hypothetical protein